MGRYYAYEDPQFQPAMRLISAITKAANAEITTTFDHDYVTGTIVRIKVPSYFGMEEINDKTGTITVTGTDTFTIDIDTRQFSTFSVPAPLWWHNQSAMVVPIGEVNSILTAAVQDVT